MYLPALHKYPHKLNNGDAMHFREEIGESLTLKFAESARKRREKGLPIISLGLGEPDFATPQKIVDATIAQLKKGNSTYSSPLGLFPLREQIAHRMKSDNDIPAKPENILVAAGAKQAFQIVLMAMLEPGDQVIVVEPAFVSFIPQLYLAEPECDVKTIDVDSESFSLPLDKIEQVVSQKTKAIVINTPNNPAGYVATEEELRKLYQIAELNDCYIISDEVYEKLIFEGHRHYSIGSFETELNRVITINGYSKSHAMTGWRLGYACYPPELNSKILKIQQHMNTNTCTFIQAAVASVGEQLDMIYLDEYCRKLKRRLALVEEAIGSSSKLSLVSPASGFFAFLNISATGKNSNDFCGELIEQAGVATTPGIAFGKNWDDHVRLSFAIDTQQLTEGLEKLAGFSEGL